jgi:hypothetical protein
MSKNDADEAVSVVSLTSNSGGYINARNSANLELLIDKTKNVINIHVCEIKGSSLMNLLIFYKLLKKLIKISSSIKMTSMIPK